MLVVVGEREASGAVASEGSPETKEDDVLGLPVILGSDELPEILLRDVWLTLVVDVQQQLLAGQQLVDTQPAGFDGDGHNQINYLLK